MGGIDGGVTAPPEEEEALGKRLKSAAFSRKLLSRTQTRALNSIEPSKLVLKQRGKDIVKKGQRKNKFLFSLPGLLAPVSGGKIGELADLNTRNPVLYLEFPNGRMKLFGTVVYPKNKYLTLQFSKSSKGVHCEDSFENMVVFSEAWWIGTREENPDETRLEFPENFNAESKMDCDFKGGAGVASKEMPSSFTKVKETCDKKSAEIVLSNGSSNDDGNGDNDIHVKEKTKIMKQETFVRQSTRTAGKSFRFSEFSEDDSSGSLDDEIKVSEVIRGIQSDVTTRAKPTQEDSTPEECEEKQSQTGKGKAQSNPKLGSLVQATLSSMYEKAKKTTKTSASDAVRSTRGSGVRKSSAAKRPSAPSSDSSAAGSEDPNQETDDSDEEWTS